MTEEHPLPDRPSGGQRENVGEIPPSILAGDVTAEHGDGSPTDSCKGSPATRRAVQQGFEATNRGDLEAAFGLYIPQVESIFPAQLVALGFDPSYRGREVRIEVQRRWLAEWGELRFELEESIDLGDRVLVVSGMKGRGLSSAAGVEIDCFFIYTLGPGGVVREQVFFDRREALESVGLPE